MTDRTSGVGVVGTERARCVLVRHGESTWNAEHRWAGQADPPLTDNGRAAAFRLAKAVATEGFAVVASSPLQRALETANIIAKHLDLPAPTVIHDLRERHAGVWTGKTSAEIEAQYPGELQAWRGGAVVSPPQSENWAVFSQRAQEALVLLSKGPATIVVAHQGVIRVAEAELGAHTTEVAGLSLWWLH